VFSVGGDPVELGLVPNINRPGENITGVTFFAKQLLQKQVGILHDLVPKASVLGLLINPNNWRHQADAGEVQAAARTLGLAVHVYVEGENVALEYRWAEARYERLPQLAAELVDRKVAVIASAFFPATLAAKAATSTIPIVFMRGPSPQ
jgi:putative ABC transport system substrate-binding protein